ncbi:VP5 [Equine encephalosis virus]|uniref:Outer capsid protein VP5 n=2 Tax=Equine encephalosis virus TaxID=201490 RepID=C3TUQ9_9REOV|nr:VP5 [Equine encephalosis virus]ACJ06239.1 VP5 [Equine encephalosis virus]QQY96744.1 VP5 [Equine encephalosis virus 1]
MGRFTKMLSRAGGAIKKAVTSQGAKKMYSALGEMAIKAANSEIGQAAMEGLVQGTIQSAIEGGSYGSNIKQAMLLSVAGRLDAPPDPTSPGEVAMRNAIIKLKAEEEEDRVFEKHNEAISRIVGEDVMKLRDIVKKGEVVQGDEIKTVETALEGLIRLNEKRTMDISQLTDAINKERVDRNEDEREMVDNYMDNIHQIKHALEVEQEAMHEEAIQEGLDMAAEVLEHASEEVPIVGAGLATAAASARAIEGGLKVKEVINKIMGVDLTHIGHKPVLPSTISTIIQNRGKQIDERQMVRSLIEKKNILEEERREVEHIRSEVLPKFKQAVSENGEAWHPKLARTTYIPMTQKPKIHVYSAPYDSDDIMIVKALSPHHAGLGFFIGFDLALDFVHFVDIHPESHVLRGGGIEVAGPSFSSAYREFFDIASNSDDVSTVQRRRLQRSGREHPIYVGSFDYDISYDMLKSNALSLVHNDDLQMHVLRGPKHLQRRMIMAAMMHGVEIIKPPESGFLSFW